MRHDWIFDVLRDLRAYALTNGLPGLAVQAEEALRVARVEIAIQPLTEGGADTEDSTAALPTPSRPH